MVTFDTDADSSVLATAVLVLNALVAVAVEVEPLLADAVPTPSADDMPSLPRLSPLASTVVVVVSVEVAESVSSPMPPCWLMSPAHAEPHRAALTATAIRDLRISPPEDGRRDRPRASSTRSMPPTVVSLPEALAAQSSLSFRSVKARQPARSLFDPAGLARRIYEVRPVKAIGTSAHARESGHFSRSSRGDGIRHGNTRNACARAHVRA